MKTHRSSQNGKAQLSAEAWIILILVAGFLIPTLLTMKSEARGPASITRGVTSLGQPSKMFYGSQGEGISPDLVALHNQYKEEQKKELDPSQYIPLDLNPQADSQTVFNRIADRSINHWWNSPEWQASPFGQRAHHVEKSMNREVIWSAPQSSVNHRLNFNVEAFQTLARIQYTGFAKASVQYRIVDATLGFQIQEELNSHQDLILKHEINSNDRMSQIAYQINF